MPATTPYHIYPCGDHAITIELGSGIDIATNQKIIALFEKLTEQKIPGVKDIIPAYHTLTLVYDLALLKKKNRSSCIYDMMYGHLQNAANAINIQAVAQKEIIKIPVCYDISLAPDIASLAETHGLSIDDVISLHTGKTYRVFMIGFLPGFAYMGSVDEKLITPRK